MSKASSTDNLSLLRGILYLDRHVSGARQGYEDLGECDKFDLEEPEISEVEQYTSRDATGGKTKGTVTKIKPKFSIQGRELATFNLALAALGLEVDFNQSSGSRSDYVLWPSVTLGKSYFFPEQNVSSLVAKNGTGTPTTLVLGTDYTRDLVSGRIYLLPTAVNIADGDPLWVSYSYPVITRKAVSPGSVKRVDASLRYVGDSADGQKFDVEIFHAQIKPSGVLAMINPPEANEYSPWTISGDVLLDSAGAFGGSTQFPFSRVVPTGTVTNS